jgi:hypothetical protein
MISLIAALALTTQLSADDGDALIRFSKEPARSAVITEIAISYRWTRSGGQDYLFRKTVRRSGGTAVETQWTDAKSCPGAQMVLRTLASFTLPKPSVPDYDGLAPRGSFRDGTLYKLEAEAAAPYIDGRLMLTSNEGTPLAEWVDSSLENLAPCWSPNRPSEFAG